MKIKLKLKSINATELGRFTRRRIGFALGRYDDVVERVTIFLNAASIAEPEPHCQVELAAHGLDTIVVSARRESEAAAVNEAIGKAARALERIREGQRLLSFQRR
jgi:hypothetical protein